MENIPNPFRSKVLIASGRGNNGGDGIVTHSFLRSFGVDSTLLLMDSTQSSRKLISEYDLSDKNIIIYQPKLSVDNYDWVIDALFGIGLSRDITGDYFSLITAINRNPNVISIDVPSGIFTDDGLEAGISVKAKHTITMGYKKLGHFLNEGKIKSGNIHVVDIGFKSTPEDSFAVKQFETSDYRALLKNYKHNVNKYSRGKALIIAGSKGMTGAGILAAKGAIKIGCGLVKSIIPESLNAIFESELIEVITVPLNDDHRGFLTNSTLPKIEKDLSWANAILVGPGLNTTDDSIFLLKSLIIKDSLPKLVLDASGFEPLIRKYISFKDLPPQTVLTPHIGEFSKIFDFDIVSVKNNPISAIRSIIPMIEDSILILKGSPTFVVNQKNIVMISDGSPLLATAGTGDVLSGMITGLIAQGYSPFVASLLGVFIHANTTVDFLKIGNRGMVASDILYIIPCTMTRLSDEI
ncbi:MAG: NAD(P)H-hydrate dehydratase [Fidelibacterota bacterium]